MIANKIACIYKITFKGTGKFYIGSTIDYKRRVAEHKYKMKAMDHANVHIQNVYNKYGDPIFEVVEEVVKWDCPIFNIILLEKEQHYIDSLNPQLNFCKVAGNTTGRKHTQETKNRISKTLKENGSCAGENNPMYGKRGELSPNWGRKYSEERKRKIGDGNKGKTLSQKTKDKISKANKGNPSPRKGVKLSEETKKKLSEALKGKISPMKGIKGKDHPNYGKKHSEEWCMNMSKGMVGKKKPPSAIEKYKKVKREASVLSVEDIIEIRRLCSEGMMTQLEIGNKFNTTSKNVSQIHRRKTWKDI